VKFGLFVLGEKPPMMSGAEVYRRNLDQCRVADELGFDEVWLAEHHFSPYGTIADPFAFGCAVAAVTNQIRIGTAVTIPAFMNPIRMAEGVAMVDAISDGRFDLGVGRGYQAHEFKRFGIPQDESTERFIEAVDVIEGLLNNESYSWEGKFSRGEDVTLYPRPVQKPVPIYVAVLYTAATIDWVVSRGYGALVGNPYIPDPELHRSLALLQESHAKAETDAATTDLWALTTAFAHKDSDFALEYPRKSIEINLDYLRQFAAPFARGEPVPSGYSAYSNWYAGIDKKELRVYDLMLTLDTTLIGSPDAVIAKLRKMHEQDGWENFILTLNKGGAMDQAEIIKAMELFATEIIPEVKKATAASTTT
jgi:alkanesulfonate monooxygenase SsuD/methylene tetrahydromethanopterin reductase-like flavin-dependent oxidoreductase (luciferase family)